MNGSTPCRFPSSLKIALFAIVFRCFVLKSCHIGDALSAEDQHGSNRSDDEDALFAIVALAVAGPRGFASSALPDGYRYYARAAGPMLEYHALRRRLWESAPGHCFMGGPQRQALCLLPAGSRERLDAWLKEAEALARGDETLAARVNRDRRCFDGIPGRRGLDAGDAAARPSSVGRACAGGALGVRP